MESVLCLLLLVLVLLMYYSGRKNVTNRRGALAGFMFWLGLAKEAIAYNLIPMLEKATGISGLSEHFIIPYSIMTWALYAGAVPTAVLFALSLGEVYPGRTQRLTLYLPAALISCFYYPWRFHIYQHGDQGFWITFAIYNLVGCVIYMLLMIRAVRQEPNPVARYQKRMVVSVLLPPVMFWVLSVFLTHPFNLTHLNKLWLGNAFVLLASVVSFLITAFHGGMMGLRLTSESYRWNSDMGLVRRGASYTRHMIKNQTAKMAWCVENLSAQFTEQGSAPPEELAILSRAIIALQDYTKKAALYADAIVLNEKAHVLEDMLHDAFSLCGCNIEGDVQLELKGTEGICLNCDRTHMTEVFVNLFSNALDAMSTPTPIEVRAVVGRGNSIFTLGVSDHGHGIPQSEVANIFSPYFTTKNAPGNLGLGLAYCTNVIQKHGGTMDVRSREGEGTTMLIRLPTNRILPGGKESRKQWTRNA